jgi:hypothetical protein
MHFALMVGCGAEVGCKQVEFVMGKNALWAQALLPALFPSLSVSPEEAFRFGRKIRSAAFIAEIGLARGAAPLTPMEVLENAAKRMAEIYKMEPPNVSLIGAAMDDGGYLRGENLDEPVPYERYEILLRGAGLLDSGAMLLPETVIELLITKVIPPVLGCYV